MQIATFSYSNATSASRLLQTTYTVSFGDTPQQISLSGASYSAYGVTGISSTTKEIWFDGSVRSTSTSTYQLYGASAAFTSGSLGGFDNALFASATPTGNNVGGLDGYGIAFIDGNYYKTLRAADGNRFSLDTYDNQMQKIGGFAGSNVSSPVCFCEGTLIEADNRNVKIENLQIGEYVKNSVGVLKPVRWIGNTHIDCRDKPGARPIRIAANAFGPGRPSRDLLVSPDHAICVDILGEMLVPAKRLVNGATISQVEVDTVTYWHVELDSHDILLANGLPAESYIDCGNRAFFAGGRSEVDPARIGSLADYCRPLADETVIAAVRSRLRIRALALGWALDSDPLAGLHMLADGQVIRPEVAGTTARFLLPVEAEDIWLVSGTSVPAAAGESRDTRRLGVSVAGLSLDDGLTARREIALDDPRLDAGFHVLETEGGVHRWTDGRARLPTSLWAGCHGHVFVRVECLENDLVRWIEPAVAAEPSWPRALLQLVASAA